MPYVLRQFIIRTQKGSAYFTHTTGRRLRRRNSKTQRSPVILYLCLRKLVQGNQMIIVMSSSTRNPTAGVLKFLRFDERFRKAPFSWRISVHGRPNHRKKAALSNFFGWTGPRLVPSPYICANTVTAICHR